MNEYRIIIRNRQTGVESILERARSRKFSYKLNHAGTCQFTLGLYDEKLVNNLFGVRGISEIRVQRNGRLVWRGVVWQIDDSNNGDNGSVEITAVEYIHFLENKRFISKSYSNTDAGQIAWDLIDTTQSETGGDLGLTQGVIESTKNRDRTYADDSVGEQIISMSQINDGYDFQITPTITDISEGVFNVYVRRIAIRDEYPLEFGEGTRNNILPGWSRSRSLSEVANRIYGFGDGYGEEQLTTLQEDTDLIEATTLIEHQITHSSVRVQTTLDDHALEELRVRRTEQPIYSLGISNKDDYIGKFDIGDVLPVRIKQGWVNVETRMRIYGMDVSITDEGTERMNLTVSPIT